MDQHFSQHDIDDNEAKCEWLRYKTKHRDVVADLSKAWSESRQYERNVALDGFYATYPEMLKFMQLNRIKIRLLIEADVAKVQ